MMYDAINSLSSSRWERLLAPRFRGPLIAGLLLGLVGFGILISITFQNVFVPAPSLVRGGSVYAIPLGNTLPPQWPNASGTQIRVINRR